MYFKILIEVKGARSELYEKNNRGWYENVALIRPLVTRWNTSESYGCKHGQKNKK